MENPQRSRRDNNTGNILSYNIRAKTDEIKTGRETAHLFSIFRHFRGQHLMVTMLKWVQEERIADCRLIGCVLQTLIHCLIS